MIVGANGTGKTTLFDVFGFLKDCLTYNVRAALQRRGSFKEVCSREASEEALFFEIQFRMQIAGKERLVTYSLTLAQTGKRKTLRET